MVEALPLCGFGGRSGGADIKLFPWLLLPLTSQHATGERERSLQETFDRLVFYIVEFHLSGRELGKFWIQEIHFGLSGSKPY